MMKQLKKVTFLLLFALILCGVKPAQAHAFNLTSTVNSKYQPVIKWKKQSCSLIKVYRQQLTAKNGYTKWAVIKKLKGSATSFTDKKAKKNANYKYVIKIYKKVKGKYVEKDYSDIWQYSGLFKPEFDELLVPEGEFSTSAIQLIFKSRLGMSVNGYQIQRKTDSTSYKTIKTLKTTKRKVTWNNTGLASSVNYTYRVRSFKKIGKKTIYSSWSNPFSRVTALKYGTYEISNFWRPTYPSGSFTLTFKSTSAQNATMTFAGLYEKEEDIDYDPAFYRTHANTYGGDVYSLFMNYITVDGRQVGLNDVVVKPGSSVTFNFKSDPLFEHYYDGHHYDDVDIHFGAYYNGVPVDIVYNVETKRVTVKMNSDLVLIY